MHTTPHRLQALSLLTLITLFSSSSLFAEVQRLDLEGASIIGSNELPQVLHIVPWKRVQMSRLKVKTRMSLSKKALEPVNRDVFLRETGFYHAIKSAE